MKKMFLIGSVAVVLIMTILILIKLGKAPQPEPAQEMKEVAKPLKTSSIRNKSREILDNNPEINKDMMNIAPSMPPPGSQEENKNDSPTDIMKLMKEKMRDPLMRQQILKMTKTEKERILKFRNMEMARSYTPLFNELGFDEEKRAEFVAIMSDYTAKSMDLILSGESEASSAGEESRIQSELDSDLKELLGADFQKYEEFKNSIRAGIPNQNPSADEDY